MRARSLFGLGPLGWLALTALACGPGPDAPRPQAKPAATASAPPLAAAPDPAPPPESPPAPAPRAGTTHVLRPASAPFAAHPEVLVHLPEGLRADRPLGLALFLHGWFGCVDVVAADEGAPCRPGIGPPRAAMGVVGAFERARVNALLVVPQLAFDAPSSDGGRLERPGGLRALVAELLASDELASALGRGRRPDDFARVIVFAHSGAYDPLGALLAQGGLTVHEVHLLDALYQVPAPLDRWARAALKSAAAGAAPPRRLSILYTDRERTGPRSVSFFRDLLAPLPAARRAALALESLSGAAPPEADFGRPFAIVRTMTTHEDVPRVYLGPLLRGAGLVELAPPPIAP